MEHQDGTHFHRVFGPFEDSQLTNAQLTVVMAAADNIIFAIKDDVADTDADALVFAQFASGVTCDSAARTVTVDVSGADMLIGSGTFAMGMKLLDSSREPYKMTLTENSREVESITITPHIIDAVT